LDDALSFKMMELEKISFQQDDLHLNVDVGLLQRILNVIIIFETCLAQ